MKLKGLHNNLKLPRKEVTYSSSQQNYSQASNSTPQQAKSQSQLNQENGYDPQGNQVMPGQDHAPGTDVYGNPDPWVQDQIEWAKQNGYLNQDGTPTEKGKQADAEANANADPNDTGDPNN